MRFWFNTIQVPRFISINIHFVFIFNGFEIFFQLELETISNFLELDASNQIIHVILEAIQ